MLASPDTTAAPGGLLTITVGAPGSGKSGWAAAQADAVRANRDILRAMLKPVWPHGDRDHEDLCTLAQHAVIEALLRAGRHVIADDTNLRTAHVVALARLAARCGAAAAVRDFTDVHPLMCKLRDAARPAPVGAAVIDRMWSTYLTDQAAAPPPVRDMIQRLTTGHVVDNQELRALLDRIDHFTDQTTGGAR